MNCIIDRIEHLDQSYATIYVNVDGRTHVLETETRNFIDCSSAEKLDFIKRLLKEKLASELNLQELVGKQFTLDTLYRKAFA